jgi:hypothetical protein
VNVDSVGSGIWGNAVFTVTGDSAPTCTVTSSRSLSDCRCGGFGVAGGSTVSDSMQVSCTDATGATAGGTCNVFVIDTRKPTLTCLDIPQGCGVSAAASANCNIGYAGCLNPPVLGDCVLENSNPPVLYSSAAVAGQIYDCTAVIWGSNPDGGIMKVASSDPAPFHVVPGGSAGPSDVTIATKEPAPLWSPNHTLQLFTLQSCVASITYKAGCGAGGQLDPNKVGTITYVTADEEEDNPIDDGISGGDGHTCNDIQAAPASPGLITQSAVLLRAERQGGGDGRVYTIHYQLTDGNGIVQINPASNTPDFVCHVVVPHDKASSSDWTKIDSGPHFCAPLNPTGEAPLAVCGAIPQHAAACNY